MPLTLRTGVGLVLGVIMLGLGLFLALHPLWSHGRSITASRWLDMAFAAFFLIRGVMHLRRLRRRPA
jgi:fatty-acid desaturase